MRLRPLFFTLPMLLTAASAGAADVPSLDLRGVHPPADPAAFMYVEPTGTPGAGNFNIGVFGSYALNPVTLDANGSEVAKIVRHQLALDYVASVGIGEKWALNIGVPTLVYQTGDDVSRYLNGATELPTTTVGSIAVGVKRTIFAPSELGGLGLAVLGRAFVPTDPRSYASDRTLGGELRALGELDLLAVTVRATAGFHLRGSKESLVRDGGDETQFGNDIPWAAGITLRPQTLGFDREGRWRWTVEARGAIATDPKFASKAQSPVLVGASARYTVGDVSALFGVETGVNGAAGNPVIRPMIGIGWAPRFQDEDKDGVADAEDECPELAEDRDGFEDQDGCPDFDDDDDGVPDESDKCPREKEDADDFQDEDGCPDLDDDGDGLPDAQDQCPREKGPIVGPRPGCTDLDPDKDGVLAEKDKCPDLPEDKDGHEDDDGCPDLDDDGDKVQDSVDACPGEKGEPSAIPELNGCKNPDHDGDTIDDAADRCPQQAEDFDGIEDDDGCPEPKAAAPLVEVLSAADVRYAKFRVYPRFVKDEVDSKSNGALRALAQLLNAHTDWVVAVGSKPAGGSAAAVQGALNRALAVALELRFLTHRDNAAEAVGWGAVKDLPLANATGLGILVLAPREPAKP